MKMKAAIVVIVVLILAGIVVYALMQSAPFPPSQQEQQEGVSESAETSEALMQDHIEDALADLVYVDEQYLQP